MTAPITLGYLIRPTGYDEARLSDKHHFRIEVRRHFQDHAPTDMFEIFYFPNLLDRDGNWRPESDKRDDPEAFLFTEAEALRRARVAVDQITVNGRTLAEWEAHWARRAVSRH